MNRQLFVFAVLAAFAGVLVSAETIESNSVLTISSENDLQSESIDDVEAKTDLLQYEAPDEAEDPVKFAMALLYQIFGVTIQNLAIKLIRGAAAVLALLIVALSAISFSI